MPQNTLEMASALRQSLARLNRPLRLQSRQTGLSPTKHSILGQLYREGAKNPKAIAVAEGLQPQSITRALEALEEERLIARKQDESDRRQFQLEITSKGRDLIVRDAKSRSQWLASAIDAHLTAFEKDLLRLSIQLFDKIADAPAVHSTNGRTQQA